MAIKILMPALSPTMTEGILSKWFIKIGDQVKAGDILAEIETDKATMEVEAVDEGKITKILIKEGPNAVPVNSTIAILNGSDQDSIKTDQKNLEEKKNKNIENSKVNIENKKNINQNNGNIEREHNKNNLNYKASPYAKKLAKQKNINLDKINGSGPGGRIIKRDLLNLDFKKEISHLGINPSTMRKIIAEKTTLTKQTVPHFYLTIESNVDKLLEMRKVINSDSEIKISINDILVKALALAQKINTKTNTAWINQKIVKNDSVDVSIAVALEEGLVTPIVKNADKKGLIEISKEIKYLVDKAKKGKLVPDDYNGGTISISNLGMLGISEFSAIINPPQSCILAVGAIKRKPGVVDEEIKIVNLIKSTLSADHRVLDGAIAGKLLKDFSDIIENPYDLWLKSNDMEII